MISNWIVAYDISEDRVRNRTSKVLEGFGVRVQASVFEVVLTREKELDELQRLLRQLELQDGDSIRMYPLCAACTEGVKELGRTDNRAFWVPSVIVI
ncbi:MAG: CRISPR-associated endonuclease Cas2 [Planctomycetota bacterium]|nr:CRISPR-associated endonuclease Cas2 [Planctomycetota bacterium]